MEMLEAFEIVGALCGIAAVAFLVYDREWRRCPLLHLQPGDYAIQLRVKNVIDEAIIVDAITATPPVIGVMEGKNASGVAILVKPYEERLLRMTLFREFEELNPTTVITIRASWRTTRSTWPRRRQVVSRIVAKDVMTVLARAKE
jgi:hypothetical protein